MPDNTPESELPELTPSDIPAIDDAFRLQFEQAQDSWVLLYPEGMVKLSQSAGEILNRCDGKRNVDSIVSSLEEAFGEQDLSQDVLSFLGIALQQKWINRVSES